MKKLEIRTDIVADDIIPHTFLFVDGKGYGFSNTEKDLSGPGKVADDTRHGHHESLARTIYITDNQYQTLMHNIALDKANPPSYSIPAGAHCTTWAMNQLNNAGIISEEVSFGTANAFTNLVETIQTNPYTQGTDHSSAFWGS